MHTTVIEENCVPCYLGNSDRGLSKQGKIMIPYWSRSNELVLIYNYIDLLFFKRDCQLNCGFQSSKK